MDAHPPDEAAPTGAVPPRSPLGDEASGPSDDGRSPARRGAIRREGSLLRKAAIIYGLVSAVALVLIVARDGLAARATLVGPRPLAELGTGLAVGLGAVLASLLFARVDAGRRAERALAELVGPLSARACVLLALLSGVGEELLFRGLLQPWMGLVPTAVLFGAVHLPPRRELLLWPLMAGLMGLAFGVLFAWSGAVLAPAVAHVSVNAINLRRLTRSLS